MKLPPRTGSTHALAIRPGLLPALLPILAIALTFLAPSPASSAPRCVVADNGSGTVAFPPYAYPGYRSPDGIALIVDGLPVGTYVLGRMSLRNIVETLVTPGGSLGGSKHNFTANVVLEMRGIGALAGYSRVITIAAIGEAHTAPKTLYAVSQSFDHVLWQLQGQITGDPDFDLLRITSGTGYGMPSPGHTTLTRRPTGDWSVDSFFDIEYRIDFIGAPGSPLAGLSGTTTRSARLYEGLPKRPTCILPVVLFPPACSDGYVSPADANLSLSGFPPGRPMTGTIVLSNLMQTSEVPGGALAGAVQNFTGNCRVDLVVAGPIPLHRTLVFPVSGTTATGPSSPGAAVDEFNSELVYMQGQITGDPDFDLLRITAGFSAGLPSPGHATLRAQPSGDKLVDSFFDIEYRIDMVGALGGALAGISSSDVWTDRFQMGQPNIETPCTVPGIGGTAALPVNCPTGYESPGGARIALDGMPPGEPLLGRITFYDVMVTSEVPGGSLEGTKQSFDTKCRMDIFGTGALTGYMRTFTFAVSGKSDAAPRPSGSTPQSVPMDMRQLFGSVPPGDPDFDLLRITAGTDFGSPSPGHTTLSRLSSGDWLVDSFFDIEYRIDFIGAPGGPLAGKSGSTNAENHFKAAEYGKLAVEGGLPSSIRVGSPVPNPSRGDISLAIELPSEAEVSVGIYDVSGRRIARVVQRRFPAGRQIVRWDGHGDDGAQVVPGVYFGRVRANGVEVAKRLVMHR